MSETTVTIDPSELARNLLKWETKRRELDELEDKIRAAVLLIGKTQTVGNVRATFSVGRRTFQYEDAIHYYVGTNGPLGEEFLAAHRKIDYDWRAMVQALKLEDIPYRQSPPSVSIKLLD